MYDKEIKMDKKAIIQELREWNDTVLRAQARPFLEPLGLTMRFDADERMDSGCIALYKGGSVFEKEILYWIDYEAMADFFIREDDCSQDAYREQIHINIFHAIGSALVEMFSDRYGQGDEVFDASVDDLPEGPLRSLLQGDGNPKLLSALSEEFAVCHQDNREADSPLYRFCMQYITQKTVADPDRLSITDDVTEVIEVVTTPTVNPEMFRRRVRSLMLSGLSQQEAEKVVASTPQKLELFYDIALGAFAIDAEAVGNTPLYNPYTGKEIPDETK